MGEAWRGLGAVDVIGESMGLQMGDGE
jgi:hypothetical protein